MKLFTSSTSPYAWVVRVLLAETGLAQRVQVQVVPTRAADSPVNAINPTGKVPTLETDDGHHLSEVRLICQYLDGLHDAGPTVDANPELEDRAFEGFVTGFVDGLAVWLRELRRGSNERSPGILEQERNRARRCLACLESTSRWRTQRADFVRVSLAVHLLNLDGRLGYANWRQDYPGVAAWHARFRERPSMAGLPRDH